MQNENVLRPQTLLLHFESLHCIDEMDNEQRGLLFTALLKYAETGELIEIEDTMARMAFKFLKPWIDRDQQHWREDKQTKSKNATAQWKARGFPDFWDIYPRKENKAEAQEVYSAITATPTEILRELKYTINNSSEWKKGKYPLPDEWLSERGNANNWFA